MRLLLLFFLLSYSFNALVAGSTDKQEEACPVTLTCHIGVNVYLPANSCEITVTPDMLLYSATTSCGATPILWVSNSGPYEPGQYSTQVYGVQSGNWNVCTASFNVRDNRAPELECAQLQYVTDNPQNIVPGIGELYTATDNCEVSYVEIAFEHVLDGGYGTMETEVKAYDPAGNDNKCYGKFTVEPLTLNPYCISTGNAEQGFIQGFTMSGNTSINNQSGYDFGRGYYVNHSAELQMGRLINLSLQPSYGARHTYQYWRIFIDLDNNGSFNTTNEMVYQWAGYGTHNGSFRMPGSRYTGLTGMRVVMASGGYPAPCQNNVPGEVEEYTVDMVSYFGRSVTATDPNSGASTSPTTETSLETAVVTSPTAVVIFPNPSRLGQAVQLNLEAEHNITQLRISNSLGQEISRQSVINKDAHRLQLETNTAINKSGLYLLTAFNQQGQRLWSRRLLVD